MKKMRLFAALLVLTMVLALLAGCGCNHEWKDANCGAPKTCALCGLTEGEKTGAHTWEDATTEAPKTCSVCGLTEGERIMTDERFTTAACKDLFGTWNGELEVTAQQMGLDANGTVTLCYEMSFSNDGKMAVKSQLKDVNEYADLMINTMYQSLADQGLSREDADKAMQNVYGQTVTEYCMSIAEGVDNELKALSANYVYYVEDGKLYSAASWEAEMGEDEIRLENGVLYMPVEEMGMEVEMHRAAV